MQISTFEVKVNCLFVLLNKGSPEKKFIDNLFPSAMDHGKTKHCTGPVSLYAVLYSRFHGGIPFFPSLKKILLQVCLTHKALQIK